MNQYNFTFDKREIERLISEGHIDAARQRVQEVCTFHKSNAEAWSLYGTILGRYGDNAAALSCFRKAIALNPYFIQAYNNMGIVYAMQNDVTRAASFFSKALNIDPKHAPGYYNLAKVQEQIGNYKEAEINYRKAITLKPDYTAAYINFAILLQLQQRLPESIKLYEVALQHVPTDARIHTNIGNLYRDQGDLKRAEACLRKAITHQMDYVDAYVNLGAIYAEEGRRKQAMAVYAKAVELRSDCSAAWAGLFHQAQYLSNWNITEYAKPILDALAAYDLAYGHVPGESPFISIARTENLLLNKSIAVAWSSHIFQQARKISIPYEFTNHSESSVTIRLAYLSNDFHDHATTHLILGMLRKHNRKDFRIYAYSYGHDDRSEYRRNLIAACDRFHDVRRYTDKEVADLIYRDKIDILIDLKGYTRGARLGICALRPAPIQVTYLGFPGTTGAEFFDYMVVDKVVVPHDQRHYYTENLIYLPNCYQPNDDSQLIPAHQFTRQQFGLPERAIVFCSFNQSFKIEPTIFAVWMDILRDVEGSVLWLFCSNPDVQLSLRKEAEIRDVSAKRIVFATKLAKDNHLARLTLADLALDTKIYNGHTTTSDALWAGIPVLTLEGNHFASRVSSSILRAIGMDELITRNLNDYRALAIYLAKNRHLLNVLKLRLKENRDKQPLFDTQRYVNNFESAMKRIFQRYRNDLEPDDIVI